MDNAYIKYMGFDVETPDYYNERICSMGIAFAQNEEVIEAQNIFVNPQCEFNQTYIVHNVKLKDVYMKPTFPEVWRMNGSILMNHILVIHNASSDIAVLKKIFALYGMQPVTLTLIDTLQVARKMRIPVDHFTLESLCAYYGIPTKPHDSGEDSKACLSLLLKFKKEGIDVDEFVKKVELDYNKNNLKNQILLTNSQIALIVEEERRKENLQRDRIKSVLNTIAIRGNSLLDYERAMLLYPSSDEIVAKYIDAVSDKCVFEKMTAKEAVTNIEKAAQRFPESIIIAEHMARAYSSMCIEETYSTTKATKRCKEIFVKFNNSEITKEEYCACLDFQALKVPKLAQKSVDELKSIFYQGESEQIAEYYAGALSSLIVNQDYSGARESIIELNRLLQKYPNNTEINEEYENATQAIETKREAIIAKEEYLHAEEALINDSNNISLARDYILSAAELLDYDSDIEEIEILKKVKAVYKAFEDDPEIIVGYVECLYAFSIYGDENKSWKTIEEIRRIYELNESQPEFIEYYASCLDNYSTYQNDHLNQCIVRLKKLYEKNNDNQKVAESYCVAMLSSIGVIAIDKAQQKRVVDKILSIKEKFSENEDILGIYEQALKEIETV